MSLPATHVSSSPAPDRRRGLLGHVVWEGVLLVLALLLVVIVLATTQVRLSNVTGSLAPLGLTAMGLALSFRTATPNLMIGSVAMLSGLVFAQVANGGAPTVVAAVVAVAAAGVVGMVVGVLVGVLTAPAWALTLGAGLLLQAYVFGKLADGSLQLESSGAPSNLFPTLWTVMFVLVSVVGGAVWMFADDVRTRLSTAREQVGPGPVDPTRVLAAVIGIGGSSALGAIAGVLSVQSTRGVFLGGDRLSLALGVVLLGGVSVHGRRGGIAGTALAAVLLTCLNLLLVVHSVSSYVTALLVPGLAIVLGLVVGRVLEAVSGPDVVPVVGVLAQPPTQPDPFVTR